jgi:uncharacterized membrane protein/outer membrane protein assembly factor BamB
MVATSISKSKLFLACGIIVLLTAGLVVGVVFNNIAVNNAEHMPDELPEELLETGDNAETASRAGKGGTIKWNVQISDEELSTPAICDLDPPIGSGDAFYEVVVGSAGDKVAAVDKAGKVKWEFTDCVIDNAHALAQGLDFDPAPFFSSVTPVDIAGGRGTELIIGEQDGVLCLSPDGSVLWKDKGTTDGYYFSSVAVCDLEGDYKGIDADGNDVGYRDDLEIILGSDNEANADAFIECWQANSNEVFRYEVELGFEHAFMTCSIVAAELDGHFYQGQKHLEQVLENTPDTLYADLLTSTHAYCGRIWSHVENGEYNQYYERATVDDPGHWGGHESYCTPAVGNFTGGPELEVIIGHGSGAMSWTTSDGTVRMYRQDGNEVVTAFTTGSAPSSVFSSIAARDAQNLDEKDLDDDEVIDYEVFFGCDNGVVYSLSATDLSELWSYQTGGRVLSSPAVCNINSDDSLEIIIGSDDGIVYCFEADPQELDRDGNPNPKDDGIEDGGGESGTYDILWMFDTKEIEGSSGEIGISSPVVGDLDRDGALEVLIGDTGGMLYCINAGGNCVPGQVDWPMFHGDLNKTGLYSPGTSFGVKVDRGTQFMNNVEGPEDLSKSVKPGDHVSYNLTVQNIGASKTFTDVDTFWLNVEQMVYKFGDPIQDHEWPEPELFGEELRWGYPIGSSALKPYVILGSMKRTNLTLNVSAPWSGDLSELCQVEVKAQSENDTFARDSVITRTSLEITLDFDVNILKEPIKDKEDDFYGQKVIKINPSDKATVEVMVKNTGNINDTYSMRLDGHQIFPDWDAYFNEVESDIYPNAMKLDALIMETQFPGKYRGSDGVLKFTIQAPSDAQEDEQLVIKVLTTSKYSEGSNYIQNITKLDYLVVLINPVPDLEIKCRQPRNYVEAGGNVSFKVEVINRGNTKITVKLEHSQLEEGWSIYFKDENDIPIVGQEKLVDVLKDGVTNVYVVIGAPRTADAGARQDVIIKGQTAGDSALVSTDSVALTAIVRQFFDINVTVTPEIIRVDPGRTISYNITVMNEGNGKDFVIITPTMLEVNWDSTFYIGKDERVTSELERNGSVVFNMRIKIPRNYLAGIYDVGINVSSIGDREIVEFQTQINKVFNLSVYGIEHSELTSDKILNDTIQPMPGVSPGSVLNFVFEVSNGGNDADWINVGLYPMKPSNTRQNRFSPADWSEFDELGWEAFFIGITNTEAYLTEVEDLDFANDIDLSHIKGPMGYLNSGNNTVRDLKIKLGVDQTVWVKVQVTIPKDIPDVHEDLHPSADEPWAFLLDAVSADPNGKNKDVDLNNNEVWVKLTILLPDLQVVGKIHHPSTITNGQIVTISAEIRNSGDISAKEVIVTFFVDGKEVKSQTINKLENGRSRLIPFTWQGASGEHKLVIKVDPEDGIVEKSEDNNEKSTTVNVESAGFLDAISSREVCSIIPIIIVVIILAIVLVIIKKKGSFFGFKPGGGGEF